MASGRSFPPQIVTCVFAADRRDWRSHTSSFFGLAGKTLRPASCGPLALWGLGFSRPFENQGDGDTGNRVAAT